MFFLTYLRRELRHRTRQAVVTTAGLAVGAGLVILAIAGALVAGSFAGWRISQLRPAEALAKVA